MPLQAEALPLAVQDELRKGESGLLHRVMTAFSRPTRIVRGKDVAASWQVREDLFELEEEPQLLAAFQRVQGQVRAWWNCTQVCAGDRVCPCASPVGCAGAGEGREDSPGAGDSIAGSPPQVSGEDRAGLCLQKFCTRAPVSSRHGICCWRPVCQFRRLAA